MTADPSDLNVKRSALNVERSESTAVNSANPWLGLASFSEETRAFFYGRDDEVAELSRRVQRKLLTILFGQSGHGKTSLLRAGLVPRLRAEGYCPVYVRIDHTPGSPPPGEQIKQAVFRATAEAGTWTQPGAAVAGESLWEFLHHRDDLLKDAAGRTLTPLLIFDQFEEIFTLAQTDATGRARAQTFLAELADLVENRPPAALEARIEHDEAAADRFDFTRADYRLLITLREDYLPHLEGLKNAMPSVTQNRVRLARMNGPQALDAVLKPGAGLVTADVARAIVLFVSGATDLAHAEVEPSLLSLVCRELNETRRARGQPAISADLLAGSRETILSEFYERTLAGQPPGVRGFIEDELLTDSGYRESIAEERVKKAFAAAGAPPAALASLVDSRLLRVEERLDVRRVELTHDVLCGVVAASRATRRERELTEAAEAQLVATRAREATTRRALFRARLVASVCALLAAAAVYGFWETRKARTRAERLATIADQSRATAVAAQAQTVEARNRIEVQRKLAESARGEAEKLVTFLVDDLWRELEPFGRFDVAKKLARSAVDYYKQLPVELRTPATERNRALALSRLGGVLAAQNSTDEAAPVLDEAVRVLDAIRATGDNSVETISGLALALRSQAGLLFNQSLVTPAVRKAEQAVDLLRGPAGANGASRNLQLDFGGGLAQLGLFQELAGQREKMVPSYLEGLQVFTRLRDTDPTDLRALQGVAMVKIRLALESSQAGRFADAQKLGEEGAAICDEIIERQPGNIVALNFRGIARYFLATAYTGTGQLTQALASQRQAAQDYEMCARLNPTAGVFWANLIGARNGIAASLGTLGRLRESADERRSALALEQKMAVSSRTAGLLGNIAYQLALTEAQLGRVAASEEAMTQFNRLQAIALKDAPPEGFVRLIQPEDQAARKRNLLVATRGHETEVFAMAREALLRIERVPADDDTNQRLKETMLNDARRDLANSAIVLGKFAEAEVAARELAGALTLRGVNTPAEKRAFAAVQVTQALAMARQGRGAESLPLVEPAVALERDFEATHPENVGAKPTLARAIFVQAVAQPADAGGRRRALLEEAQRLMSETKGEQAQLGASQELREWIAQELAK